MKIIKTGSELFGTQRFFTLKKSKLCATYFRYSHPPKSGTSQERIILLSPHTNCLGEVFTNIQIRNYAQKNLHIWCYLDHTPPTLALLSKKANQRANRKSHTKKNLNLLIENSESWKLKNWNPKLKREIEEWNKKSKIGLKIEFSHITYYPPASHILLRVTDELCRRILNFF